MVLYYLGKFSQFDSFLNRKYMKIKVLFILTAASLFLPAVSSLARVTLPDVISDNMVVQRNSDVKLWGKAAPGRRVKVQVSWNTATYTAKVPDDGNWAVSVPTPDAGGPYTISFDDGEKIYVQNVLSGEVWFCSGQSNMEMPMKGFMGQPVENSAEYILAAKEETPIRMCNVKREFAFEKKDNCSCKWDVHTPKAVMNTSATAYFFALRLWETLGVPVGIIHSSWGGTPIQAWMDRELIEAEFPGEFDLSAYQTGKREKAQNVAGTLYNAMIHPLVNYTIKGVIWYQGCANRGNPEQYKRLQPSFAKMLREKWDNPQMPFYFTQIAPYRYGDPQEREAGYMMWAQAQTLDLIPFSGMATTHDIGETATIHPRKKKEVGDRLAYLALANNYGFNFLDAKAPVPTSFKFEDGKAIVSFKVGAMGLNPINRKLASFEVAGEDRVFYPAVAKVSANRKEVEVSAPEVPAPVAVRYGIRNVSEASLFNSAGIPATPFRSDDWERE